MATHGRKLTIVALTIGIGLAGTISVAAASSPAPTIKACARTRDGALRQIIGTQKCVRGERAVNWAAQGTPGARGAAGARGHQGNPGPVGLSGYAVVTSNPVSVNLASNADGTASCPAGTEPLGGGPNSTSLYTEASHPETDGGEGWTVTMHNAGLTSATFTVTVVCASVS